MWDCKMVRPQEGEIARHEVRRDGEVVAVRATGPGTAPRQLALAFTPVVDTDPDELMIAGFDFVPSDRKLEVGVWTPWAEVLCLDCCHGKHPDRPPKRTDPDIGDRDRWALSANCDSCGKVIWIDNKVACEQRMVTALKGCGMNAAMSQTGGMCSGVEVMSSGDEFWMLLTIDECAMSEFEHSWCVGVFHYDKCDEVEEYRGEVLSFEQAIAHAAIICEIWKSS